MAGRNRSAAAALVPANVGPVRIVRSRFARPAGVAALLSALGLAVSAQARDAFEELERQAHEHELAGRFAIAQAAFAEALVAAATEASRLSQGAAGTAEEAACAADLWAWCEVLAEKAWELSHWTSCPAELLPSFESARQACAAAAGGQPVASGRVAAEPELRSAVARSASELESWLTYRLGELAFRTGDYRRRAAEYAKLGFITDWRVIGPFENEQGGGFRTPYPPEQELAFDAVYPGKKHPCRWRELPAVPPDGVIDLDEMLRPNEECIAYAATFVRSKDRRELELRVASDDGFELWLNGRKLASRDVERACVFDQDVIPAVLEPGWNAILVKVADAHVAWEFSLRVTDRSGRPVRDLEVSASSVREFPRAEGPPEQTRIGGAAARFQERLARVLDCAGGGFLEVFDSAESPARMLAEAAGVDVPGSPAALMELARSRSAADWARSLQGRAREISRTELARLWYGLSRVITSRGAHGVKDHPDRAALARALELEPSNPVYIHALSRVSTDWVVMEAERNESPRVRLLKELLRVEPRAAVAHYELASYYLRSQRNAARALEHARQALEITPEFPLAELVEVDAHAERGFDELARARLDELARRYPRNPVIQGRLAHALLSAGNASGARAAYANALASDAEVEAWRQGLLGSTIASGRLHMAIELVSRRCAADPFDVESRLELARLLEAKGDHMAAADACREGLKIAPDDHELLEKLGRCLQALGRLDEAREVWRRALEVQPNFVRLERYLEFLDGKVTYDRRFAEDTAALLEDARVYVPREDDPLVEVLEKAIDRVYIDGTRSRTTHRIILVRNSRGVELLGTPYVFFYPEEQVVKVRTARVHRADGSVEDGPTGDDGRVVRTGYAARSARAIELPPLRAGDIVELEYRVDDIRQSFFGKYFGETFRFQGQYPRLRSKYVLIAPKDRQLFFHTRGGEIAPTKEEWPEEQAVVYTWNLEPAEKIRSEPLMPPPEELGLQVQVSTYQDWREFGVWYWNLVKDTHQTSPEMEAKARELAAGAPDELGKIRAIYDFVSSEIQYSAWEFGVHGFKPYRTTKIFDQRFGDCKDKAALMKTMLACIGVESYPALVEATLRRPEEDLSLPLFDHFNHMILYVPAKGDRKELWLDGTTTLHGMDVVPVSNAGALACVIHPEGGRLVRIPQEGPEGNSLSEEAEIELSRSRGRLAAQVTIRARARGWVATFLRYRLNSREAARKTLERLYARQVPSLRATDVATSDLEDIAAPVSYELRAVAGEFGVSRTGDRSASGTGGGRWFFRTLRSPLRGAFGGEWALLAPENLSDYASLGEREHDLVLAAPWRHESRVTYTLAEGLEFAAVPENVELSGPFGRFSVRYERDGRKLVVTKVVELSTNRVKAADYQAFRTFVNRADRAERQEIGVRP